jgi:hypothetical protein
MRDAGLIFKILGETIWFCARLKSLLIGRAACISWALSQCLFSFGLISPSFTLFGRTFWISLLTLCMLLLALFCGREHCWQSLSVASEPTDHLRHTETHESAARGSYFYGTPAVLADKKLEEQLLIISVLKNPLLRPAFAFFLLPWKTILAYSPERAGRQLSVRLWKCCSTRINIRKKLALWA